MPSALPDFEEIRALVRSLPPFDGAAQAETREAVLARHGLDYEAEAAMVGWIAGAQRRCPPAILHPRVALFVATHGIAADLPVATGALLLAEVAAILDGDSPLNRRVEAEDADLRLYELALHLPTRDARHAPAMPEDEAARAMAYGMMALEPGLDLVVLAALGRGAELAATAILAALAPDRPPAASGDDGRIAAAISRHGPADDPLALLASLGGPDIAAMAGAILAARLAGTAVILDGKAAEAAAAIVKRLRPDAIDHCLAAGDGETLRAGLGALDLLRQASGLLVA
jgi:nicotinate-nucleotide--dimethylbenzimidazole phosphoribosyltransferase